MKLIFLLAIFGTTFCLKETSGPFDILDKLRNKLFTNKYLGAFFYKLFDCYFCLASHVAWILYWISTGHFNLIDMFLWSMAGGIFSIAVSKLIFRE